ncbi:MAG: VCBS domain-containing protein, partial [Pirellulaceae bacterium]|nr:VCBS domain-containing protein [Pirellulaceae bacterium]
VIDNTELTDTLTWTFNSGSEHFNYLAVGQSLVLTYTITVTDSQGATDTQDVVITINATNDVPVITVGGGDSAAETLVETNATLSTTGTLTVTDLDLTDSVTSTVTSVVASGTTNGLQSNNAALLAMLASTPNVIDNTELTDTLTWTFNSGSEYFNYLAVGQSLVLTYTITVTDSQGAIDTQEVVITINATNDVPVISIESGDSAGDTLAVTGAGLQTSGTLSVEDLDRSDLVTATVTGFNKFGDQLGLTRSDAQLLAMLTTNSLVIDGTTEQGSLNWSFDSAGYAFEYLATTESLTLVYTLTVTDSQGTTDTQTVTIVISGENFAPEISLGTGDSAAEAVTETDSTLTTQGTLSVVDVNTTDIVMAAVSSVSASGTTLGLQANNSALLGMLSVNSPVILSGSTTGTLQGAFDSASEAFDYLAVGESLVLTYTLTVTDIRGDTDSQDVVVTINGSNDGPQLMVGYLSVNENSANGTVVGPVMGSDVDVSNVLTYSLLDNASGRFVINSATGQITVADGSLLDYETSTSHQVLARVTDTAGAFADLSITIVVNNVNEAPVFGGVTYRTDYITTVQYSAPGLLDGVWDPEGDVLTTRLAHGPHSGAIVVRSDGSFIYWPEVHFEGTTEIVVEIFDGELITPVVYRFEVIRPKVLPPNFGISAESGPPLHSLTPEERAEHDPKNHRDSRPAREKPNERGAADASGSGNVAALGEDAEEVPADGDPNSLVRGNELEDLVNGKKRGPMDWTLARANFDWVTEWQESRRGRYELELSQLGRLPEVTSYEVDVFELGHLGSKVAGSWVLESFDLPKTNSSNPEWAPMISSHLELTVSLGATAAWLVFHGRMLAAAAAANALREAVDPTRLLEQAMESHSGNIN